MDSVGQLLVKTEPTSPNHDVTKDLPNLPNFDLPNDFNATYGFQDANDFISSESNQTSRKQTVEQLR